MKQKRDMGVSPCTVLRKDVIDRHCKFVMHSEAFKHEATRLSAVQKGGIEQAFQKTFSCNGKLR